MKNNLLKSIKPFVVRHEPEVLITMGIMGMIFSTVWGVRATEKAVRKLDIKKKELDKDKLTLPEVLNETWKLYLPVVISTAVSIPCIIASNRVSNNRNVALAAAYTVTETALQEYQDKTKEVIGDSNYEKIQEALSDDKVKNNYAQGNVIMIGDGDAMFYEPISNRYFKSNWNRISKAANELNASAISDMCGEVTLNDWYDILGLPPIYGGDGNERGWTIIDGKDGLIDISIDAVLTPKDEPCGAIRYNVLPKHLGK